MHIGAADKALPYVMASVSGRSAADLLSEAIQQRKRRWLLEQTNDAYARLRQKPCRWQDEVENRAAWDKTLSDGMA